MKLIRALLNIKRIIHQLFNPTYDHFIFDLLRKEYILLIVAFIIIPEGMDDTEDPKVPSRHLK